MENIFKHPKSTLLGLLAAAVLFLVTAFSGGNFDLTTVLPTLGTVLIGALSTDNSALVEFFFTHWRTTLVGMGTAGVTGLLDLLKHGTFSPKALLLGAAVAAFGWVQKSAPKRDTEAG
ncbi:MAG TPA: hypothetical protein VNQ79_15805 [Blastocatellia bacterium]|nr:hypothetical protein [Blastocatellia bacterium]